VYFGRRAVLGFEGYFLMLSNVQSLASAEPAAVLTIIPSMDMDSLLPDRTASCS
jgi:hypothetical protein